MNITKEKVPEVLKKLLSKKILSLDCETSGLRLYHGDSLFSIVICDGEESYYFNFNKNDLNYPEHANTVLDLKDHFNLFSDLLSSDALFIMANAKFDMRCLDIEGLPTPKNVYDILVMARVENNSHMSYSLDSCAKRIGYEKDDSVEKYIKEFRLYKKEEHNGKIRTIKHFNKVPLPIIQKYAEIDAEITFKIYEHQQEVFKRWEDETLGIKTATFIVSNEKNLTRVCFDIEKRGMLIDRIYCEEMVSKLQLKIHNLQSEFFELTGTPFVDSPKSLSVSLGKIGILGGKTELGGASFTDDVLSKESHRAASVVLEHREYNKKLTSYFNQFLYFADKDDYVHCNIRQSATSTGRCSITDPALQTLNANESDEFSVRRAFIPPKDFCFVSIDYKAFEFRAMLDLAGEVELAKKIECGLDPHQATADMVGISRKEAKTLNFMLLYGGGQQKLADSLGIALEEGAKIKRKYFSALPKVKYLIYKSTEKARERGFVWNIFNRRYFFPNSNFCYKALNYLIQGSTSDAMKLAMVRTSDFLSSNKLRSRLVLTVHDELLLYIHKEELDIIPKLMEIMRNAYPSFFHKMDCSVEHSWKSWGDLEEGLPNGI